MLSKLLVASSKAPDFTLNLFESREEEVGFVKEAELAVQAEAKPKGTIVRVDARGGRPLASFLPDAPASAGNAARSRGDDLLHLMDSAQ